MYNAESRTWSFLTLHILLLYFIGNCIYEAKKCSAGMRQGTFFFMFLKNLRSESPSMF